MPLSPFEEMRRRLKKTRKPRKLTAWEKKQAREQQQREIKKQVLELDTVCVVCEQKPSFDPHHIAKRSRMPKKANYLLNECGICRSCHDRIHLFGTLKTTGTRLALVLWEWSKADEDYIAGEPKRLRMPDDEQVRHEAVSVA